MIEFRVTKYDPAFRNTKGAFTRDEWTSVSDIGKSFCGVVLTEPEYRRVENAYAAAAKAFVREGGASPLVVTGLENNRAVPLWFAEGAALDATNIGVVVRRVLREAFWCRLEAADGFIHFGYDYYMYVGVRRPCPGAEALARPLGLFVEPFRSPYSEQGV